MGKYYLTDEDVASIRSAIGSNRNKIVNSVDDENIDPVLEPFLVKITTEQPDGTSGLYEGMVQKYNSDTKEWEDHYECRVIDNGYGLLEKHLYIAKYIQRHEEFAVYAVLELMETAIVRITSNVPDTQGYYPGVVQRFNLTTRVWYDVVACKVRDANS